VDFVRGLGTPDVRAAMEQHRGECPQCNRMVTLLNQLVEMAGTDTAFAVPDSVVQAAVDLFGEPRDPQEGPAAGARHAKGAK